MTLAGGGGGFLDRPLMAPWSGLWGGKAGGDAYRGTPVVVKMENPNWSISEISSPEDDDEDILGRNDAEAG